MTTSINESISVMTAYNATSGQVLPWKIKWRQRLYTIKKIGYHHAVREGRKLLHIFSVSNDSLAFRLRLDTETLHWTLEEIAEETVLV